MADVDTSDVLIIPEGPRKKGARAIGIGDKRVRASLGEAALAIAGGAQIQAVAKTIIGSVGEIFGVSEMILEVISSDLKGKLRWVFYGMDEERAKPILKNLSADYHPTELVLRTLDKRFKVSPNGYFIPAEEWLKLVDADPFGDHPSYYRHPENERAPRAGPDEWHEADVYMFSVKDLSEKVLAIFELSYSVDGKLLSKGELEAIDAFVQLLALALTHEQLKERAVSRVPTAERAGLLEDVLKITSSVVSEKDPKKLAHMILASISSLFGFGKVSLVIYDETEGLFRWMALHGYGESQMRDAMARTIPTDVILEDLNETRRIGKAAYFTPAEDVSPRSRSYYVAGSTDGSLSAVGRRTDSDFRKGDCLALSLQDSAGRIVGAIYPSDPADGLVPSKETMLSLEIFTSLAQVIIENYRLTKDREEALRLTSQRTEQLSRILDLVSGVMYVKNLPLMLDNLLKTLARLVGTRRMVLGVKDATGSVYRVEATYGYSPKAAEEIKKVTYDAETVDGLREVSGTRADSYIRWWTKVGRMTYYMPAESLQSLAPGELAYYPDPDLMRLPRAGKGHWHELDWMDTLVMDKDGVPIAYLETLKPKDDRVPGPDTIEIIEIYASLAGIAIENARMFQEYIDSRREAELYTDILSHDIKNFNQAILGYLELMRMRAEKPETVSVINKISEQVINTSWLASNVRTMSHVTFGDVELSKIDIGTVLRECEKSLAQSYPGRKVLLTGDIEKGVSFVEADELIRELFMNILTNAVKYDPHEPVEIELSMLKTFEDNRKSWTVSISDHGVGIPDEVKPIIFDRFSKAPKKKGSGMGLHIVKALAKRYGGRVWVEDRVQGDHSKGTVVRVQLPAVD